MGNSLSGRYSRIWDRVGYYLIYISLFTVIIDGLFGLDVFLNNSERLSLIYRIPFLIKFSLIVFAIFIFRKVPKDFISLLIVTIIIFKIILGIYYFDSIKSYFGHLYFYTFIILGYLGAWQMTISKIKPFGINKFWFGFMIWMIFLIVLTYFILYSSGFIGYFGLGLQTFIFVSVLMSYQSSLLLNVLVFLSIILTGKRSSFLIYVTQVLGPVLVNKRISIKAIFIILFGMISFVFLAYQVGLLARFEGFVDLYKEFSFDNSNNNRSLFYFASGGRTEEIYAYFIDNEINIFTILFGELPGSTFTITNLTGEEFDHYYFHISPLNFIFHFGIPIGSFIILYQLRLFIWALNQAKKSKDIFVFLYIGYYLSSLFGAVIIIDIFYWLVFFRCSFLKRKI